MKRVAPYLLALVVICAAGAAGYYVYTTYPNSLSLPDLSFSAPCSKPIPYTVGSIDPRFGLTKDDIVAKLAQAAGIWNAAAGKTVLEYEPNDANAMPVNFVYDQREETVALGNQIDSTEASQDTERGQLETDQAQYVAAQQSYASAVSAFNDESASYAQEVKQANGAGGADPTTYAQLNAEQASLKQKQIDLQSQGQALNAQGQALEQRIDAYNATVSSINQVVSTFNAAGGENFEEGEYVRTASGAQHIDIYAYKNQAELLHSLTHEFGHSIGLGHNQNPASIMFPYTTTTTTLSPDDLAALKVVCKFQ